MPDRIQTLAGMLMLVFAVTVNAQAIDPPEIGGDNDIDPGALAVLESMANYLKSLDRFEFRTEIAFDTVQDFGVKVEFGSSRKTLVSRPDKLRMESQRRDGSKATLILDGDAIWVYAPEQNAYATHEQPGDIDETLDFAVAQLRLKAPVADIVSPDLYENVTANLTRALYLRETVVAGVECAHLLFSNGYADFQLWITTDDKPRPWRIVISYPAEEGHPQFRAQFLQWNMDLAPAEVAAQLRFEPPDEAERIRFYVGAPEDDETLEDES